MIRVKGSNFRITERRLLRLQNQTFNRVLRSIGDFGVRELSSVTPRDTGETATSWSYRIETARGHSTITWTNSKMAGGIPLVVLLNHGYRTGTGGFVSGRNFIGPAMRGVYNRIFDMIKREVRL